MDYHNRVLLSELEAGDTVIIKNYYFTFVRIEEHSERTYWLYATLKTNGETYRYPWPKSASIACIKKES